MRRVLSFLSVVFLVTPAAFAQESIVGVWERIAVDADGRIAPDPAPMLLVYTDVGVYVQVSFRLDRQDSRPLAELNADELGARFSGTSAQHGTYAVAGNRITRQIVGSFTPINQGREQVVYFKIEGDVMATSGSEITRIPPSGIRFRRVKNAK